MGASDLGFVRSTWIDHQSAQKYFKKCPRRVMREAYGISVDDRLGRSMAMVLCADDDENQIFGYIVYDYKTIHFVYVKLMYRNMGFFKKLIENLGNEIDCYSSNTDDKCFNRYIKEKRLIFNPWA